MKFHTAFPFSRLSFSCWRAQRKLSEYVDGALDSKNQRFVATHLKYCPMCQDRFQDLSRARSLCRKLKPVTIPSDVALRLRVMASREHARHASGNPSWFDFEPVAVRLKNLMQPLAIPFAGGIVSTLVLFSMMVPTYPRAVRTSVADDVPTTFYTDPTVKNMAPFALSSDEVVVELTIDENGRVVDYRLPAAPASASLRRAIENNLLFTTFTPAMAFGQPISGRILLSFRRSQIDVKG